MNADRLLALYDRVADAPGAVSRLRRFVLDLAVRGELVRQDPANDPVSELLSQARRELRERAKSAKRVRWKEAEPVSPEEIQTVVPAGWVPARVNDTGLYVNGLAFRPDDWKESGTPIIRIQNLTDPSKAFNFAEADFPDEVIVRAGDLLVSWSATLDAFRWDRGEGVLNQHIFRVIPANGLTTRDFLLLLLKAAIRALANSDHAHGLVMKHINRRPFLNHVVLIPPLAEQHRIVSKVDELMTLCDQLEERRNARETARGRLTKASYSQLSATDTDSPTFRSHAQFAVDALRALTVHSDQVNHLRHTILNLAVRGKLVEQDPAEAPASELLQRIEAEKARLVKSGEIRKPRPVAELDEGELPFRLPTGWAWTQIARLGVVSPRNEAPDDLPASFVPMPLVAAEYGVGHRHEIRPWGKIKKGYTHFAEGDVGLAKITPCFENGKSTVFRDLTGGLGSGTTELHVLRPLFLAADYIVLFLKSSHFIESGKPKMTGTAGQKRVPREYFTASPFPLPPLAEQHRIVAKVDELMQLCDRMKAGLGTAAATRGRLLDSLLHESLVSQEAARTWDGPGAAASGR